MQERPAKMPNLSIMLSSSKGKSITNFTLETLFLPDQGVQVRIEESFWVRIMFGRFAIAQIDTGSFLDSCWISECGEAGVLCMAGVWQGYCSFTEIRDMVWGHPMGSAETDSSCSYLRDSNDSAPGSTVQYYNNRKRCGLHVLQKQPI